MLCMSYIIVIIVHISKIVLTLVGYVIHQSWIRLEWLYQNCVKIYLQPQVVAPVAVCLATQVIWTDGTITLKLLS